MATTDAPFARPTDAPADGSAGDFDVIVIGAGPVGENVAQYATEGNSLTAVLVERELVGGECSYYACMPSKALLRPLEVAAAASDLSPLSTPVIDTAALLAHRDQWVSHYDDAGQVSWAESAGIEVVRGHGRLIGERMVEVVSGSQRRVLRARKAVVLATGGEPSVPDQFVAALPWGSRDATGVVEVPDSIAIVGGGVVACEAATWLSGLGCRVVMLVRGERILEGVEPFASEAVLASLRDLGIEVRLSTAVTTCRRDDAVDTGLGRVHGGPVTLVTEAGESLTTAEVLMATGRRPRLGDVGLEVLGLAPDAVRHGRLPGWLLAVGDASGEAPLTHWGKYRARVIGERLGAQPGEEPSPAPETVPVPQVVFTDPQVAAVGMTEAAARQAGIDVVTVRVPFNAAAGSALLRDHVRGHAQLVVSRHTRTLVGATFVGPEAAELVHAATIAIVGQVPVSVLRHAVPSYPTSSELWLRLLEELPRDLRR